MRLALWIATVLGRARLCPSLFILARLRLARTEPRPPGTEPRPPGEAQAPPCPSSQSDQGQQPGDRHPGSDPERSGVVGVDQGVLAGLHGGPAHHPVGAEDRCGGAVDGQGPPRVEGIGEDDQTGPLELGDQLDVLGLVATDGDRLLRADPRPRADAGEGPWLVGLDEGKGGANPAAGGPASRHNGSV